MTRSEILRRVNNRRSLVTCKGSSYYTEYLLLGDVEADDWMDDMIQTLEKIKRPEHRESEKKQIALMAEIGDH